MQNDNYHSYIITSFNKSVYIINLPALVNDETNLIDDSLNEVREALTDTNGNIVNIQTSLPFALAIDPETGDYGYIKVGADSVTPFKSGDSGGIPAELMVLLCKSTYTEDEFTELILEKYAPYIFSNPNISDSFVGKQVIINHRFYNYNITEGHRTFTIADVNHENSNGTFDLISDNIGNTTMMFDSTLSTSDKLWKNAEIRNFCNDTLYNWFEGPIKPYILRRQVKTYNGSSYDITEDYVALLSVTELGVSWSKASISTGEGEKYSKHFNYTSSSTDIDPKKIKAPTKTKLPNSWWTRTYSNYMTYGVIAISDSGCINQKGFDSFELNTHCGIVIVFRLQANLNNIDYIAEESIFDGKSVIAQAITNKGVATEPLDTFNAMADNINAIYQGLNFQNMYNNKVNDKCLFMLIVDYNSNQTGNYTYYELDESTSTKNGAHFTVFNSVPNSTWSNANISDFLFPKVSAITFEHNKRYKLDIFIFTRHTNYMYSGQSYYTTISVTDLYAFKGHNSGKAYFIPDKSTIKINGSSFRVNISCECVLKFKYTGSYSSAKVNNSSIKKLQYNQSKSGTTSGDMEYLGGRLFECFDLPAFVGSAKDNTNASAGMIQTIAIVSEL